MTEGKTFTTENTVSINKPTSLKNIEDIYELSPLQEDNLKKYIHAPGEGMFHENLLFNFEGQVDTEVFKKCWKKILERHSILRTSVFYQGLKKPIQAVHREVELPLEILDWQDKDLQEHEKMFDELNEQCRATDYNLNAAPLMRLSLIIKSDEKFSLWWRFHHMIMDGWAFTVVLWDFLTLYKYYSGAEKNISILPGYPYKDYINYLKNRDTSEEQAFWNEYLKDFVPQKDLIGLKSPEPGSVTTKTRQGRIDYPIKELYQPLKTLIKANELTLNGVFQGVFTLLMSYYSDGETDIVTGQTAADRPLGLLNSQSRVGLFVNTLPIRVKIDKDSKFVRWTKELQTSMMKTFNFTSSSEQDIKRWCGVPEDQHIYHSALVFKNIPLNDDPFKGLPFRISDYSLESRPHFPLAVFVWPDENLELKIIYDNKRYSLDSAWDVLLKIKNALERIIEKPEITVSELMNF